MGTKRGERVPRPRGRGWWCGGEEGRDGRYGECRGRGGFRLPVATMKVMEESKIRTEVKGMSGD